jgi:hypothetical protein
MYRVIPVGKNIVVEIYEKNINVDACVNIYTLHFSSLLSHLLLIVVQVFVSLLPSNMMKHLSFMFLPKSYHR